MKYNPIIVLLICISYTVLAQQHNYRIISYNVENLFDTRNDPLKEDDPFTPQGVKHWSDHRYAQKLLHIGRTLANLCQTHITPLIALQEIENYHILDDLVSKTALAATPYAYLHRESNDLRGIDVALLYNPLHFRPLETQYLNPAQSVSSPFATRDLLYCKGVLDGLDTLHIFVCHLPSRIDGKTITDQKREIFIQTIRELSDSIFTTNSQSNIFILGDFNTTCRDPVLTALAHCIGKSTSLQSNKLYNNHPSTFNPHHGTYKYKGKWETIDHIIISGYLYLPQKDKLVISGKTSILHSTKLLSEDKKHYGFKPFATYNGRIYLGGYSDHLPIYVDFTRY